MLLILNKHFFVKNIISIKYTEKKAAFQNYF